MPSESRLNSMSEGLVSNQAADQELPQPDWHQVAQPLVSLRSLALVGLLVPLLLMAGVFWLHHLPVGTAQRSGDNVIEVRVVAQPDAAPSQDVAQPIHASLKQETEPLIEDPTGSTPDKADESVPIATQPQPERPSTAPASPSDAPHWSIKREAAMF